ncbi:V-set and immunoglobulin domain-containing protein 10 isoform X1 [Bactrocera dorsalis]|uniref:Lachesin n=1 Tax=Bactrocera dorsalis TaxID=27457 RepID=A0A6I9VLP4_BACDO|nr:V-set and immunoglobulin domain-containing protein 10 isoform X1 [Bactrocera dorsalis]XP_011211389.2 V-set and immunoglobulin domain-containing protein 10 isoform X1 [Bactrocera dorsalis]
MLLEYVMMLLVFGLTTNVERSQSNAYAFEGTTRYPPHHHRPPPQNALTSSGHHHPQQHHFDSISLAGHLAASSLVSSSSPSLASLSQLELSNVIVDSFEGVGGIGGGGGEPQFENTTEREVIAAVGTTARLHCRVRNLGDRAVSWIRKRDLHILTIGIMTYTNDQRFLARHTDNSDEWVLKVVSVQPRDAGVYECQVSTEPKISQAYKLMVVTSKAQILSNRELYIQSGSDINLTCIAPQAPGPYTHMMWYKDSELINDSTRGGIRVVSEQQMKTSNLVISRVLHRDSGNYTCAADNSNSDSVLVHIIKSEQHAAMQHELATRMQTPRLMLVLLAFFYLFERAIK